jgi:HEAT repeat protein
MQYSGAAQPMMDVALGEKTSEDTLALCQQLLALAERWDADAAHQLVEYLDDPDPFVRWQAGEALAQMVTGLHRRGHSLRARTAGQGTALTFTRLVEIVQESLQNASHRQRAAIADALGRWRQVAATPLLIATLRDPEMAVRVSAASALGQAGDDDAVGALVKALRDESLWVRRAAAEALGAIGSPLAVPALAEALQSFSDSAIESDIAATDDGCVSALVRASLVGALGHFHSPKARSLLISASEDPELAVRWQAVRGLGKIGDVSALPMLKALLQDDAQVAGRSIAELAAEAITAIEHRQQGWGNWLRKMFHQLWFGWRRRNRQQS